MSTRREVVVTVAACDTTVLVARAGQEPMATTIQAWRDFLADVRAGRYDRQR
jgi:hypothetical protein